MMASCFLTVGVMSWLIHSPVPWTSAPRWAFPLSVNQDQPFLFNFFPEDFLPQEQESN